ncbi:hypothetical protein PZ897_04525 [Hoeflea sp. YIM 152468]|uniref:hypothetical protein n=1 Tax=Hoeflea sp. YIM 152468 TaxID=3031759 RepID=UPI0023D9DEF6|nr:hypothetical protein [Hoeflea sp. YIM 152468]MDF1607433.1 hypothetical protein [Hoeflea sp. YIM 152468]
MFSKFRILPLCLAAFSLLFAAPALSRDKDSIFFQSAAGSWKGPGEIVAGKYKGTKFVCNLSGDPVNGKATGISLDGSCRVGVFNQKMSAVITRKGATYTGRFLDGSAGDGLDIVSGKITGNRAVMGINRKTLNGAMIARLQDTETMNVTISVKVGEQMIPVIGMTLKRKVDNVKTGALR